MAKQRGAPKKYWFKKGVSGNPKGRPKGKTMKEFAREFLEKMSDEEKIKFMNSLDPDLVWKMAEGNPATNSEITGKDGKDLPLLVKFIDGKDDNSDGIQKTV